MKKGDRIAQLVLEKICLADIVETDVCPAALCPGLYDEAYS